MEDSDMSVLKNNRCGRVNVQRNSFYPGKGIKKKPKLLWRFEAGSRIVGSPIAVDGTVFMACGDNTLYALDAITGKEKWSFKTKGLINSIPAYENGKIFFCCEDSFLYCLDAATGKVFWKYEIDRISDCSPAVSNGVVYFGTNDGFFALDAKSSKPIWINNNARTLEMSPAVGSRMVYARSIEMINPAIYALDIKSGEIKWKYPDEEDSDIEGDEFGGDSLALSDDILCFAIGYNTYYAVDANTGKEIWTFEVEGSYGNPLQAPAIADGKVIIHNRDVHISWYAIDLKTGEEIWRFKGQTYRNEAVDGTPCIADGIIHIGTDAGFFGLDLQTGKLRWKYTIWGNENVSSDPAIEDDVIFYYSVLLSCLQAVKARKFKYLPFF